MVTELIQADEDAPELGKANNLRFKINSILNSNNDDATAELGESIAPSRVQKAHKGLQMAEKAINQAKKADTAQAKVKTSSQAAAAKKPSASKGEAGKQQEHHAH